MPTAIIIDDKHLTANSLEQMLHLLGVKARIALSARAGVILLKEKIPEVVFLDIHMPGADGLEFLKYIRNMPGCANLPIIVHTSDDQPEIARQAKALGAFDILIKPVSLDLVESTLKRAKVV